MIKSSVSPWNQLRGFIARASAPRLLISLFDNWSQLTCRMGAPIGGGVAFDRFCARNEDPATSKAAQKRMKRRCRVKTLIDRWSEIGSRMIRQSVRYRRVPAGG